ncbi:FkbM family methyltransferase [Roseisalinus antarcticus]|uniref:Methyltransferase domain protein n=1 Tax=Roseisalinus antarcticus TaxID=254357 RepID=A0A1Y5S5M0_9RHOB|nr:FkbM family methyltransferase [Roseisalinus antarcticus]SLN32800.1 Methyltransferase domain protein [Roseisalinus antarcticus]
MPETDLKDRFRYWSAWLGKSLPGKIGEDAGTEYFRIRRLQEGSDRAGRAFKACVKRLGPQHTVIDLGANMGRFTRMLSRTGARVHAFEPDPWTFDELKSRVPDHDNVTFHQAAAGAADGEATFRRDPGFLKNRQGRSAGNGLYDSVLWDDGDSESFSVRVVDFAGFIEGLGGDIELVKMDIEGAEVDVLDRLIETGMLARIRHLFVETREWQIPAVRPGLTRLRKRLARVERPEIHLDWQ